MGVGSRAELAALRQCWAECSAAQPVIKLRDGLVTKSTAAFTLIQSGSIRSVSGMGHNVEMDDSPGSVSPSDMVEIWNSLIDLFDDCKAFLGGGNELTDAQIETEMEKNLRPIRGYTNDFSQMSH